MWNVWPDWYWLETAQTFDGIDDKVTIENTDQLNFSGEITLSAWVKIEETGGYRGILEHGYYGGREVFLRIASGKYQVGIYQSKTNSMAEAAVDPADIGTWVHLVGTYDGTNWNLYKNGELIASSPSTVGVLPVNCDWLIGGSQATNRCFKGEIRDAGIWNTAMTPDEVSTHYAQGFSQAVVSSATYDAVGNILTQTDAMGNTTSYTYDTMGRVLTVTDALNNVTSYTYDALGRLLTTTDDVLWSLTDHLGTVRDILGATSTHLIYDAFGNLLSGTNPLLFGYTGKAFDADTNLQNNINRWYDAAIGRWLSIDPIGFEGNDTNLYRYVKNRGIVAYDIMGLKIITCASIHPRGSEDIRYMFVSEDEMECQPCRKFGLMYIMVQNKMEIDKIESFCNNDSKIEEEVVRVLNWIHTPPLTFFRDEHPVPVGQIHSCGTWCDTFKEKMWAEVPGFFPV